MDFSDTPKKKRAYLNEPSDPAAAIGIDLKQLAGNGVDLADIFFELTRELLKHYAINKGVLVIRRDDTQCLAAVSTWKDGSTRDGLTVNLPADSSLFEKVAEHGQVYTEEFCGSFSGNFFERKLLLEDDSRSFVVQPLKANGQVVGLLGYSSASPTAFAMFEEGSVEKIAADLASVIRPDGNDD